MFYFWILTFHLAQRFQYVFGQEQFMA